MVQDLHDLGGDLVTSAYWLTLPYIVYLAKFSIFAELLSFFFMVTVLAVPILFSVMIPVA